MQREMRTMPGQLRDMGGNLNPEMDNFINNMTVPDVQFFLQQLDVVDNAACSWLSMLKVCVWCCEFGLLQVSRRAQLWGANG